MALVSKLRVVAYDADGKVDEQHRRIGLRTLELIREPDEFGESFRFRCNGLDFFAKGGNWILRCLPITH